MWNGLERTGVQSSQTERSPDHHCPPAEAVHDEPGENGAYKAHGDGAEVERERVARADTGLLEEVDKLTGESETTAVSTL